MKDKVIERRILISNIMNETDMVKKFSDNQVIVDVFLVGPCFVYLDNLDISYVNILYKAGLSERKREIKNLYDMIG